VNIIILAAGVGKRFFDDGYVEPKPMVKVLAKPIIYWLLDTLNTKEEDKVIIVLNKNHSSFRIKDSIKHQYKNNNINFHEVDYTTRGAAETLYSCIDLIDDSQPVLVLDSDTFYEEDILQNCRDIKESFIFYFNSSSAEPIYSYISITKNFITEIKEKNKISDNACSGAYGFKNKNIIKKYCEQILDKKIKSKNEYYISCLYQEMLNDKHKIIPIQIKTENVICLGTPTQIKCFASNKINTISGKTFCFDLDNTLVTYPEIDGDYSTVKPIKENIDLVNKLKNKNKIIIYTARRMKTFNGNVSDVIKNIGDITKDTLLKFNIQYDELIFGKPYADYYIDDLAINSTHDVKQELGIFENYIEPRKTNKIYIKNDVVVKETSNKGEIYWYENIPHSIKKYFPNIYSINSNKISMERMTGIPLSYVYINGTLTKNTLFSILDSLNEIHNGMSVIKTTDIYSNYKLKLNKRYNDYDYSEYKNYKSVYESINAFLNFYENNDLATAKIIHGDPVFSNCFIDDSIKFIDMRGNLNGKLSLIGDENYDWAKVYQSILGYDFILLNKKLNKKTIDTTKDYFNEWFVLKNKENSLGHIKQITNSLLFSLIPLHDNEKCKAYYDLIEIG
jgi:capsule biosynthesis phosphatase